MPLKIKRMEWDDFLVLEEDGNFPRRSEANLTMDIDNHVEVLRKCRIKRRDYVLDVGAFIGDTAYVFARYGCIVDAFEPFFDAFVCLVYNTRGWPVKCWNVATGNGESVQLVDEPIAGNLGMRRVKPEPTGQKTVRLDDLELRHPVRFMKVDCEGSEVPTLLGARALIARDRPILFVEMFKEGLERAGYTPEQLSETITGLGYSMEMWGEAPRWDWICRPL